MKKYLIVLAAALVTLASCDQKDQLTDIKFKESQVSLMVGDTIRLALIATPAETPLDNVVWASSDTNVVKIVDNKGNITAVGSGSANVTAKVGKLEAVCQVTAASYVEAWTPDWLWYFPSSKTLISDEIVEMEGGYKCKLYSIRFFIPNPMDFDADGMGEGYAIWANAAIPFIEEGEYKDQMYHRALQFTSNKAQLTQPFASLAGSIDAAVVGPACQNYLEAYAAGAPDLSEADIEALTSGNQGALIQYTWSDDEGVGPSYFASGIVTDGYMQLAYDENDEAYVDYNFSAQWDYWDFINCLDVDPEQENLTEMLIQPFQLALSPAIHYVYGQLGKEAASAPRHKMPKATMGKKMEKPVRAKFAPVKAVK